MGKELNISNSSVQRILQDDLGYFPYKKIIQTAITDVQKQKKKTNLQIGYSIILKKMISEIGFFQMEKYLVWMGCIMHKMIEYGQLIVRKLIKKAEKRKNINLQQKLWFG